MDEVDICLLNTHLESTKEGQANRVQQLSYLLRLVKNTGNDLIVIAGGDLNLRDKEVKLF